MNKKHILHFIIYPILTLGALSVAKFYTDINASLLIGAFILIAAICYFLVFKIDKKKVLSLVHEMTFASFLLFISIQYLRGEMATTGLLILYVAVIFTGVGSYYLLIRKT